MRRKLLRIYIKIRNAAREGWNEQYMHKEMREQRIGEISKELLAQDITVRLDMLKSINDKVIHKSEIEKQKLIQKYEVYDNIIKGWK